jgi:hypothetical protein
VLQSPLDGSEILKYPRSVPAQIAVVRKNSVQKLPHFWTILDDLFPAYEKEKF